jgi:hypothetical protein
MARILIDNESIGAQPASGKSTIFIDSTTKKLSQQDDGGTQRGVLSRNSTTASQGAGFAADTYVTNSNLLIPSCGIQAGMVFRWYISLSKTGAGTAAAVFTFRLGSGLSTSDTSILALTSATAQTAAASSGLFIVSLGVRTTGGSGVVAGGVGVATNTAGLGGGIDGVSGSVNLASAAGLSMGISMNGGASAAWTITSVTGELIG